MKTATILEQWKHRQLSLEGKILIVNTLIASLFVYKMTVLPTMPDCYIKEIYALINKFIWNGRKPKITLAQLQKNIDCGGLKLVKFENKDAALKIKLA